MLRQQVPEKDALHARFSRYAHSHSMIRTHQSSNFACEPRRAWNTQLWCSMCGSVQSPRSPCSLALCSSQVILPDYDRCAQIRLRLLCVNWSMAIKMFIPSTLQCKNHFFNRLSYPHRQPSLLNTPSARDRLSYLLHYGYPIK